MKTMTFDEYDRLLEAFDRIDPAKAKPFYPSPTEFEEMENDPEKWVDFACYLYEKGAEPKNNTEKYSRANLRDFIHEYLQLVDNDNSEEETD
ncbi:hypothetical protein LKD70_09030 [Ruminococcus sp. CLA-AA-H200]|uniref:Uncharacterized protein n=1 Tax=Ruminococcus turbiniformis TaxID=2881258 RepID=A0ABS8FZG3_9FIRM|nr:hypothetical protein [Ruminococcus turbiniformis]MCC2254557.1 hypothetical protein [Ruminococcus turbiniformis]